MNGLRVVIIMCVFMLTFSCVQLKKKKTNTHYNNVDTIFVCYALLHRVFCYFVLSPSTQVYPLLHVIFSSFQIPVLPKTKLFNGPLICFKLTRIDLLTTRQVRVDILIHFKMQVGIWFCPPLKRGDARHDHNDFDLSLSQLLSESWIVSNMKLNGW